VSPAHAQPNRPDPFTTIPDFTVTQMPDGTWRGRHLVDHTLVIDRATWPDLGAACRTERLARGSMPIKRQEDYPLPHVSPHPRGQPRCGHPLPGHR
jgi:hypothetical protein